jgi:hypothetical protein
MGLSGCTVCELSSVVPSILVIPLVDAVECVTT